MALQSMPKILSSCLILIVKHYIEWDFSYKNVGLGYNPINGITMKINAS